MGRWTRTLGPSRPPLHKIKYQTLGGAQLQPSLGFSLKTPLRCSGLKSNLSLHLGRCPPPCPRAAVRRGAGGDHFMTLSQRWAGARKQNLPAAGCGTGQRFLHPPSRPKPQAHQGCALRLVLPPKCWVTFEDQPFSCAPRSPSVGNVAVGKGRSRTPPAAALSPGSGLFFRAVPIHGVSREGHGDLTP